MFKLLKKKRNQETENLDSIFPSAKNTLKNTRKKWRPITAEEILEKIEYEASRGQREARFYDYYISDELVRELKSQGYTLHIRSASSNMGPYFKVRW